MRRKKVYVRLLNVFIVRFFHIESWRIGNGIQKGKSHCKQEKTGIFKDRSFFRYAQILSFTLTPLGWTTGARFTSCLATSDVSLRMR